MAAWDDHFFPMGSMLNMKRLIIAAAALAIGMGAAHAQDKTKVGFVYVGPVGDFGWSYQHDQGRLAIEEKFGDKVETTFAADGADLIFTTSFGFMNPTAKVAERFPDVKFEHATGYKRADNLSTYAARFYEGRYIIGQIAGKMTKSNTVGYIVSFPIPEVVRGINSFMLGAQSVNPDLKVKIIWVNSWFDPGKEADAAKALIDQGADILVQHTDSPAAMQVAEERGIHAFGQASDMIGFGPKAQLTSIVDVWDEYYIDRVQAVMDGTWESMDTWGGLDADMVHMAEYTNMPDDVKQMAMETEEKIRSGELHPFAGPIKNQAGEIAIPDGKEASDKELLSMNWYVEGIDDKLPQ